MQDQTIFQTPRLFIRSAILDDLEMYFRLWTEPRVMGNVGFPHGLRITEKEIREKSRYVENTERELRKRTIASHSTANKTALSV